MIHVISLCHMPSPIIAASMMQMLNTGQVGNTLPLAIKFWLVDHHWPIDAEYYSEDIRGIAKMVGGTVLKPEKNLGGTEGFNWAVAQIKPDSDDLLLWYDPDSWPVNKGWLEAMITVMQADKTIATLSLWPPELIPQEHVIEDCVIEDATGHAVAFFPHRSEMFSVTMWRAAFALPRVDACHEFYGQIEVPAYRKASILGMRNAWLFNFYERECPIPHPQVYEDWKTEHVAGTFLGNFKEYYDANRKK